MHHLSAYGASFGSVTDTDTVAAIDTVLQTRNSHLIMSENFNVAALFGTGTTLQRAKFGNIGLSFRGTNHLWPLGATATIPSRPYLMDLVDSPLVLPLNEEITILTTTNAVGPAAASYLLFLTKPTWNRNKPVGQEVLTTRATVNIGAGAAFAWTGDSPLVFERDLFNGVYAVTGATVSSANSPAFRMLFKSMVPVEGRQLRPGGLTMNAVGDFPWPRQLAGLGEWGRFYTFEPPSIQTWNDTVGGVYEVRLNLTYLGGDKGLLFAAQY